MQCPKYIREALEKRTKAANAWNKYDSIVSRYIQEHNLDQYIDSADFFGGVEGIVNPEESERRILEAIENA